MGVRIDVITNWPSAEKMEKQIRFGTAVGLTRTAQDAQGAVVERLKDQFTLRNKWFEKSNRFGIKVRAAKPAAMEAEVYTLADWLPIHEEGGDKRPQRRFVAVPTSNVRRTKKGIIRKALRPKNLVRSFLITTKKNNVPIIFQRRGKGAKSDIFAMYVLRPFTKIRKAGTFLAAASKKIREVRDEHVRKEIAKAIASIK